MICKHVQDPVKAWRRERQNGHAGAERVKPVVVDNQIATVADQGSETGTKIDQTKISLPRNNLQLSHKLQKEMKEPDDQTQRVPVFQQTESLLQSSSLHLFQKMQTEVHSPADGTPCISIFFCSAGTIAEKLAHKLHRWLKSLVKDSSNLRLCSRPKPLNSLSASDLTTESILLLIVSSTGQGEIPPNGLGFPKLCENISSKQLMDRTQGFRFAVFGNGDSRYSATYNGAANKINDQLIQIGGCPLIAGVFQADTAVDSVPLSALRTWLNKIQPSIVDQAIESLAMTVQRSATSEKREAILVTVTPVAPLGQMYEDYQDRLLSTLGKASLVDASSRTHEGGSLLVTFGVGNDAFDEMSCIQILPSNAPSKVNQALQLLCVNGTDRVDLGLDQRNPTYASFLTDYVDLELPLSSADCLDAMESAAHGGLTRASLSSLSIHKVLERLHSSIIQMTDAQRGKLIHAMCQDMPLLHTRTYSIASSQHHPSSRRRRRGNGSTGREVDIMVKVIPRGRFSETFLSDSTVHASSLGYRIVDSPSGATLRKNHQKPFVVVATGAGFCPVRSLLQWRIALVRDGPPPLPSNRTSGISLFLGLKPADVSLIVDVLNEAMALDLIDVLDIVLSNPMKRRVYDNLGPYQPRLRDKLLKREGVVFVCANRDAASATKGAVEDVIGGKVGDVLGERYVEEVY